MTPLPAIRMVIEARHLHLYIGSHLLFSKYVCTHGEPRSDLLSTPITILGKFVHPLATRLHLIPRAAGDIESGGYAQLPGGPRAEAERRRYESYETCVCGYF